MTRKQKIITAALAVLLLGGCAESAAVSESAVTKTPPQAVETTKARQGKSASSFSAGITNEGQSPCADTEPKTPAAIPVVFETDTGPLADSAQNAPAPQPPAPEPTPDDRLSSATAPAIQPPQAAQPEEPAPPSAVETPAPEPMPEPAAVQPEPTPTPEPNPIPVPAFDVSACVQNAMRYGNSIGLAPDSTATACWDNPATANAQSLYIERDLCDRLDWYKASGFTAFWVWAEQTGDGSYLVYIGYA